MKELIHFVEHLTLLEVRNLLSQVLPIMHEVEDTSSIEDDIDVNAFQRPIASLTAVFGEWPEKLRRVL